MINQAGFAPAVQLNMGNDIRIQLAKQQQSDNLVVCIYWVYTFLFLKSRPSDNVKINLLVQVIEGSSNTNRNKHMTLTSTATKSTEVCAVSGIQVRLNKFFHVAGHLCSDERQVLEVTLMRTVRHNAVHHPVVRSAKTHHRAAGVTKKRGHLLHCAA